MKQLCMRFCSRTLEILKLLLRTFREFPLGKRIVLRFVLPLIKELVSHSLLVRELNVRICSLGFYLLETLC